MTPDEIRAEGGMSDDQRFALTYPRGLDRLADNLNPERGSHTITVYGAEDLERRLGEAERLGIRDQVSWCNLTPDEPEA